MNKKELTKIVILVQNDNSQFEKLYHAIEKKVYFWCYSITGDKTEANDLGQESMLAIYKGINGLRNPEYFTSWMYQTVRRAGINHMKKLNRKDYQLLGNYDFDETFESQVEDKSIDSKPEMVLDLKQTKELMLQFIKKLPKKQQEIVCLHYLEELQISEIADILGCKQGTIKSSLFNARQSLKSQIELYQKKNNIRLYSIGLIPLIMLTYQSYVNDICKLNKMTYSKEQFQSSSASVAQYSTLSISSITAIVAPLLIVAGIVFLLAAQSNKPDISIVEDSNTDLMNNKLKKYQYIVSYNYYHFPSRSVSVSVGLSKDVDEKDISILYDSNEISVQQKNQMLYFQAMENGKYEVIVKGEKIIIHITNITPEAPFLESVNKDLENAYLELNINGNKELIDYSKSYLIYEDKRYTITNDDIVFGQYQGNVQIILFDKHNNFIRYEVNLANN